MHFMHFLFIYDKSITKPPQSAIAKIPYKKESSELYILYLPSAMAFSMQCAVCTAGAAGGFSRGFFLFQMHYNKRNNNQNHSQKK